MTARLPRVARAARMRSWQASSDKALNGSKEMVAVCMLFSEIRLFFRLTVGLSLNPRQTGLATAADSIAVAAGVLVALEAVEDVVAVAEAGFGRRRGRRHRAGTAAAEEHDQRFGINLAFQFGQEVRVAHAAGVLVPFNLDRVGNTADPVPFGAGPDINDLGAGRQLQQLGGFLRCQFALVGAAKSLAAGAGKAEYVG